MPIAEFVTTSHDSVNITKYLFSIKKIFENSLNSKRRFVVPPIVVTDFSWALIIAVLEAFNNCSVISYLQWTYDVLVKYSENQQLNQLMKTRIIICQTHIFKAVVEKTNSYIENRRSIDKSYDKNNKIKKFFLFCFTVLQNSTCLNEFNEFIQDIYQIFCKEFSTKKTIICVEKIKMHILKRNFDIFKIIDTQFLTKIKTVESNLKIYINPESNNNLKKCSPYIKHFKDIINSIPTEDYNIKTFNEYFSPELFNIIEEKLHLLPFWTGIMIRQCQSVQANMTYIENDCKIFDATRITNNPVENRIEFLKNKLLMKKRNLVTSEIIKPIYNDIKSKYFEYYSSNDQNSTNFNGIKSTKIKHEQWMDKRVKNIKREKSYYYKNLLSTSSLNQETSK